MTNVEEKSNIIAPAWDGIIGIHSNEKNFVFYYLVMAAAISNEPEMLLNFILLRYHTFPAELSAVKMPFVKRLEKLWREGFKEMSIMSAHTRGPWGSLLLLALFLWWFICTFWTGFQSSFIEVTRIFKLLILCLGEDSCFSRENVHHHQKSRAHPSCLH